MKYRLVVNSYLDPDPVRNAELVEAAVVNAGVFDEVQPVSGRPTFAELFAVANRLTAPDDINVIANTDVSFDDTIRAADDNLDIGECWALSRDDNHSADSQDAWVFYGPIIVPPECDFAAGIPGCDNRLAFLLDQVGYRLTNPCHTVRVRHHHASGIRRYHRRFDLVRGPYKMIPPQAIGPKVWS